MKNTELHCILHLRIFLFGDGLRKLCLLAFHSLSFKPHNSSKQHFGVKLYNVFISNCNAEGGFVFEMFFGRNIMCCLCLERELVLGLCHHLSYLPGWQHWLCSDKGIEDNRNVTFRSPPPACGLDKCHIKTAAAMWLVDAISDYFIEHLARKPQKEMEDLFWSWECPKSDWEPYGWRVIV